MTSQRDMSTGRGRDFGSRLQEAVALPGIASLVSSASVMESFGSRLQEAVALPGIASLVSELDRTKFDVLVNSIREDETQVDLANLERQFKKLPDGEALLAHAAAELNLTVPFTHDPAVRAALQIIITAMFTVLMLSLITALPTASSALQFLGGTPTAVGTWKAVGVAYDRLYNRKHYHPEKGNRPFLPPTSGHRLSKNRGTW